MVDSLKKTGFPAFFRCRLSRRAFPADWTDTQPHSTLRIDHAASEIIHGEPGLDIGSRGHDPDRVGRGGAIPARQEPAGVGAIAPLQDGDRREDQGHGAPRLGVPRDYGRLGALVDAVKRSLQTKRFELPQQSAAVSAHFCNESVYGNLNVLCVTGVVRLDPNADVGGDDATPVTLDWPSEATRAAAKRARKKLLKGPANYPGPWND